MDGLPVKPAIVQVNHGLLCILFTAELKAKSAFLEKLQEIKDFWYLRLRASNETRSYFRFLGQSIKSRVNMPAFH